MRLDHLLSKEHPRGPSSEGRQEPGPLTGLVAPESITGYSAGRSPVRPVPPRQGRGTAAPGTTRSRTLLSFEGTSPKGRAPSPRGSPDTEPAGASGEAARRGRRAGNLENYIASASIFSCQVTKGTRWMPWRQKPMKDVGGCDKPRGAANLALIRGCPNGETRHGSCRVTPV